MTIFDHYFTPPQRETGALASAVERARNALAWIDPNVSLVLAAAVVAAGLAASLLLLLAGAVVSIVPPRWLLVAAVAPALLPPVREGMAMERNPVPGSLLFFPVFRLCFPVFLPPKRFIFYFPPLNIVSLNLDGFYVWGWGG